MRRLIIKLLVLCFCFFVLGCGSDSNNGSSNSGEDQQAESSYKTGSFIDSAVEGLEYSTSPGGLAGETTSKGEFQFLEGDNISFYIGDILLGEVNAKKLITPVDFVNDGYSNEGYPSKAVNIMRLLQTLDADGDPLNKISIPDDIKSISENLEVDFDLSKELFAQNDDVYTLCSNTELVSEADAINHYQRSLNKIIENDLYIYGKEENQKQEVYGPKEISYSFDTHESEGGGSCNATFFKNYFNDKSSVTVLDDRHANYIIYQDLKMLFNGKYSKWDIYLTFKYVFGKYQFKLIISESDKKGWFYIDGDLPNFAVEQITPDEAETYIMDRRFFETIHTSSFNYDPDKDLSIKNLNSLDDSFDITFGSYFLKR